MVPLIVMDTITTVLECAMVLTAATTAITVDTLSVPITEKLWSVEQAPLAKTVVETTAICSEVKAIAATTAACSEMKVAAATTAVCSEMRAAAVLSVAPLICTHAATVPSAIAAHAATAVSTGTATAVRTLTVQLRGTRM